MGSRLESQKCKQRTCCTMKGPLVILSVASASAWNYVNGPSSRPNNCGCTDPIFCKVVYINPKTVNKAERSNGRIQVTQSKQSLDVVFDDLGNDIGAGISGTLIEKDGRPYTVEPCPKNTDNERQFHKLIRQHLMVKSDAEPTADERAECCLNAAKCEKVEANIDLADQVSLESVYLETSLDPNNFFDVKTAAKFSFKQKKKLSRNTVEKIYTNGKQVLTLTTRGSERYAVVTQRGSAADGELFSLRQCDAGDGWFWRSAPQSDFVPGARANGERYDAPDNQNDHYYDYSLKELLDDTYPDERAVQGPNTCYFNDVFYCQLDQDAYVLDPIELGPGNVTDGDGQDWCNTKCHNTPTCTHFTWTKFRKVQMCYLMKDCLVDKKDPCLTEAPQVCMSGPANCGPLPNNTDCGQLVDHGPGYVDWQCRDFLGNDVEAYKGGPIAWGTVCVQSCDSWLAQGSNLSYPIEAHLVSKCEQNGTWSNTVAYDGRGTLMFPPPGNAGSASDVSPYSLYPVPSDTKEKSLMCECEGLQLKWPQEKGRLNPAGGATYNPNTENVNDFLCDYVVDASNSWTVASNNSCAFFCDSYLTAVVRCWDGKWTGQPDLGFWCQNKPFDSDGPTSQWDGH